MPVHIDHLETSVEILPSTAHSAPQRAGHGAASETAPRVDVRELVMRVLEDELDRFSRMRGL
jgi:hypothetical protein